MSEFRLPLVKGPGAGELVAWTVVDGEDARFGAYTWRLARVGYACRGVDYRLVYLHREILGLTPGDQRAADHINGDKLDNRRANLRVVTQRQNVQNRGASVGRRFRGVFAVGSRWRAQVMLDGVTRHLGCFDTAEEAHEVAKAWRLEHMPYSERDRVEDRV